MKFQYYFYKKVLHYCKNTYFFKITSFFLAHMVILYGLGVVILEQVDTLPIN